MTIARSHPELVTLRKLAQELATARKERLTSVHLLAAIAARDGEAAELLRERRLDREALLKATRSFDEDEPDALVRAMTAARDVSKRSPRKEPSALHLLIALLADRRCAAHRALVHSGVDLGRLRTSALQLTLGVVAARRTLPSPMVPAEGTRIDDAPSSRPSARSSAPGVTVPLFPPPPRGDRPTSVASPSHPGAPAPAATPPAPVPVAPPPLPPPSPSPSSPSARADERPAPASWPPRRNQRAREALVRVEAPARRNGSRRSADGSSAARFALDRSRFPTLASVGKNLTLAAAEGRLEKVVGRDGEIDQVLDVLAKRHANSACLIGPAGVGKTSIARGVAHRFAEAEGAPRLLIEVVVSELVAGTGARGAMAERIGAIRTELRCAAGEVVLFVDEVHELFDGGAMDEAMAEMKLALARGELALIGATTPEHYRKVIESDAALARRFSVIDVEEPDEADAFLLVKEVATELARHHGLAYADEAIATAISWSVRYLPGRALPDKAIAILDLAGARARRRSAEAVSKLARGGHEARSKMRATLPLASVGISEVAHVVSELADLPVDRLLETDRARMLALETLLGERVVGHSASLARIAKILRRNAAGLRSRRPIGSFLLLGPTGVGKTETAKAIAEALFHNADAMTRLDLSEYAESHAVARLVGAPPGYIGHEAGGQLTEAVRRRPYQVILLDEIEKAHRDVLEAFLQVFDEGRLTDGRGRRVDFTNTVIVLTSNLGAAQGRAVRTDRPVGFGRAEALAPADGRVAEAMVAAARAELPPELYNRLDEVLCFGALSQNEVAEIARRLLDGLAAALEQRGIRLEVEDGVVGALLAAGGFDPELGARPMKRAIGRLVEGPLADMILRGELERGSVALVGVEGAEIVCDALAGARAVG